MTIDKILDDNGRELVTNLPHPQVLQALPFGTRSAATYISTSGPPATMTVVDLPLVGRLTSTVMIGANVARPSTCNIFGGTAKLGAQFTIKDNVNPARVFAGKDTWYCHPVGMINP